MSLSGRLEDLQLRDLLQVLCLSHNNGLLQLSSGVDRAELLFREGLVVSAWRQENKQANPLSGIHPRGIDGTVLALARRLQKEMVPFRTLDHLLIEECGLAQDKLGSFLLSNIIPLVQELLSWDEGAFSFQSGPVAETVQNFACGEHICLETGLNIDDLLHEKSVTLPVLKMAPEKSSLTDSSDEVDGSASVSHHGTHPEVLLVDDDPDICRKLVHVLTQHGIAARSFSSGKDLLRYARSAWQAEQSPLLMIDLIMPRFNGGGILGGLELVEQVQSLGADKLCLVYSDYPCPEVEQRLQKLGVNELLKKPNSQNTNPDDYLSAIEEFSNALADKAVSLLGASAAAFAVSSSAIRSSVTTPLDAEEEFLATSHSAGMGVLKGMLQELQVVESEAQVMLLVLRFASEVLGRAVLFSVGKENIAGLGQFGYGDAEGSADKKVKGICLPLSGQSAFREVLERPAARWVSLGEGYWDKYLCQELGLGSCGEVFVGPLVADGQVTAFLCGDNQNTSYGTEDMNALEIFLQQAGLALENLQRKKQLNHLSSMFGKTLAC